MFIPNFKITAALAKLLMDIEASRQAVTDLPITVRVLTSLRESARLVSTHYSTQIEGNRLTQEQVEHVLHGGTLPNRERDEREVKHYYLALDHLDTLINTPSPSITETDIQVLHGLVMNGKAAATLYRDGQNVIRDGGNNAIVYMPPEAKDVPTLMQDLIAWVNDEVEKAELPIPIIAGIAHYQYATIHPYCDGNGRTARLLTNWVLHKCGYGLKGIYSLEEYYAKNLQGYYEALAIGDSHNYYFGRADGDITNWITYFCDGMADAFAKIRLQAAEAAEAAKSSSSIDHSSLLRELDQRQKQILSLFSQSKYITTKEIAMALKLHRRTALNICNLWLEEGFLIKHGQAAKSRKYELSEKWRHLIL